jgi:hypothetical protein
MKILGIFKFDVICIKYVFLVLCSQRRCCPTCWTRGAMSVTRLRRAGTGRCYLPGRAAWWGIQVSSLTQIFFGVGRVGHYRCRGRQPPRRWYVAVLERRTSMSVVICMCWKGCILTPGRFFRDLTWAIILWGLLIFGCSSPAAQHPVDVQFERFMWFLWCIRVKKMDPSYVTGLFDMY